MDQIDKHIVNDVIEETATREQAREVVGWLSSTSEGHTYLSELIDRDAVYLEADNRNTKNIPSEQSVNILTEINRRIKFRKTRRLTWQIAAAIIPFVFLIGVGIYLNSQVSLFGPTLYSEVYVPKGKQEHILFQDGSEAYLNSDTRLCYPKKFGLTKRKIFLEGEAYFNIASNKKRPFVVQINNTDVTVLGTSFNVEAYKDEKEMKIVLDKGNIFFNTPQKSYQILPGQLATYDVITGKCIIDYIEKPYEASIWRDNIIIFKDTPLADVIKTLNRRYNTNFIVQNPKALTYSYTLTTNQTSLEHIINELEKIAPVKFSIQNYGVKIFLK